MKRFLQLTLIIALAVGAVSCKKDEILNTVKETPKDTPTVKNLPPKQKITLSASSTKPGLRVAYDASKGTSVDDDNTLWQEGDQIAVYNVGVNGSPAVFTLVAGAGTSYGTFEGTIEPTGNYYGVYPASAAGDLDGTSIAITLPATQNYAANSFGRDAAVFAATSTTEGDDVVLHFEPLLGYLSLSLTTPANSSRNTNTSIVGGHSVGSIVLHENSLGGVALSGNATVDMSSADYEHNVPPTLSAAQGGGLDVTLNCGGVQLGSTPVEFIIAVPAGALSKGLCATVNDISGNKIMSLATTASNTITANIITKLQPAQDVYNIEDRAGKRYPVSKIGAQIWMGENLRCLTYDTNSGCTDIILTSHEPDFAPHYVDVGDESLWDERIWDESCHELDGIKDPADYAEVMKYRSKFGYSYSWAGYVGVNDATAYKESFSGNRQGICPNGWHIPVADDYIDLFYYAGTHLEENEVGKLLKCVDGWSFWEEDPEARGTDDFGYTALPTGVYNAHTPHEIGWNATFGTADVTDQYSTNYFFFVNYAPNMWMYGKVNAAKQNAIAIRCIKD